MLHLIHDVFGGRDGESVLPPGDKRRSRPPLRHAAQTEVLIAGILLHGFKLRRLLGKAHQSAKILSESFHIDPHYRISHLEADLGLG